MLEFGGGTRLVRTRDALRLSAGPPGFIVGVDLGQSRDYTAIAVVHDQEVKGAWDAGYYTHLWERRLALRHLQRVPLGTPYPEVAQRVAEVTQSRELAGQCRLVVDGTGVGRPVVDLLKEARPGCPLTAVTVTPGNQETRNGEYYGVPKQQLMVGLQVLLQSGGLKIAGKLPLAKELEKEMSDMEVRVSGPGREQYGAWREGQHDDLVFAVALACWEARRRKFWNDVGGGRVV